MLASKYSGRWDDQLERDEEGQIFIDFPPHLFEPLVTLLRARLGETKPDWEVPAPTPDYFGGDERRYRSFLAMLEYYGIFEAFYPVRIRTLLADMQGDPDQERFPQLFVSSGVQFKTVAAVFFLLEPTLPGYRISSYEIEVIKNQSHGNDEGPHSNPGLDPFRGFQCGWYNPTEYGKPNVPDRDQHQIHICRAEKFPRGVLHCSRKRVMPFLRRPFTPQTTPLQFPREIPHGWVPLFGGIGVWRLSKVTLEQIREGNEANPSSCDAQAGQKRSSTAMDGGGH